MEDDKKGINSNSSISDDKITVQVDNLRITDSSVVDLLDSDEKTNEETQKSTASGVIKRIAKKSTTTSEIKQTAAVTRRQVALANTKKNSSRDKFMENFDPECSARERRKLTRKANAVNNVTRKVPGAVYDENGVHMATGIDLCDCLVRACPGCHFPCPKCKSPKCGPECRCNRKYAYDQIEYQGRDLIVKNPLNK